MVLEGLELKCLVFEHLVWWHRFGDCGIIVTVPNLVQVGHQGWALKGHVHFWLWPKRSASYLLQHMRGTGHTLLLL